jgi:CHAT domain-containing protein/predicted negative regulator of RcsB-dependent stress response
MGTLLKKGWIIWGMILFGLALGHVNPVRSSENAGTAAARGDYALAVDKWSQELSRAQGTKLITLLLRRGEAYRALGHYQKAATDFISAREKAKKENHPLLETIAAQSLGYVYYQEQKLEMAEALLRSALESAQLLDQPALASGCANRLGIVLLALDQPDKARELYLRALNLNARAEDPGLRATLYLNLAHIEKGNGAFEYLHAAQKSVQSIKSPYEQAQLLIDIAIEARFKDPGNKQLEFRYTLLNSGLSVAKGVGSDRLISLASGKMGELYESQRQFEEAMGLTEQALGSAQTINAPDLLLKWEWQRGRILRAQGLQEKAISAFTRAVFHIQAVRQDLPAHYQGGCASLRETFSPIYLNLADMLLLQSGEEKDPLVRQNLLKKAQQAVESIKQSQLRDYFKDPCIDALSQQIESLSPGTAVIYPIIFSDRLELLADIGGKLYRKKSPVKKEILEKTITLLVGNLRNRLFHEKLGMAVYAWLIDPLESLFAAHHVDTLIFVPDGVFRMLPIAALWDGKTFLTEKYAVATEPGLSLLDPKPLPRGDMKTLLAGMSTPGPVVFDLPQTLWDTLSQASLSGMDRNIRGLSVKPAQLNRSDRSISVKPSGEKTGDHVKQILALPGVDKEIDDLSKNLPNNIFLNKDFLLERFARELKEQDYRIVHIASHGFFGGSPEENFIMTYDKLLNMNDLENFIKPKQLSDQPVELITLSACQTAEGDDRSPLGLAGVALKSGARSVIGSLWPVSDLATQQLLSDFYLNLKDENNSKAEALRQAQIKLIKTEHFEHPFYWSAFILVGNWL